MDSYAIFVIVERGKADHIVDEVKKAGAFGATIFYGRGTGEKEFLKFFNLNVESSKEIILVLTDGERKQPLIDSFVQAGKLKEPGTGILFTVPVGDLIGLHHRKGISTQ